MKKLLLPLFLLFLLTFCGKEIGHKRIFLPDTIDGVTNYPLTDHTKEANFTGNWEAPLLTGKGKVKIRKISKGTGENHSIRNSPLIKRTLLFYLFNHLKTASKIKQEIVKPELRKSDVNALKSLGYL